jgi:hypothetical protein
LGRWPLRRFVVSGEDRDRFFFFAGAGGSGWTGRQSARLSIVLWRTRRCLRCHARGIASGQNENWWSNCQTLFGMTAIPSDAYIRLKLDGASPVTFDPLFFKTIETEGVLAPFQRLGARTLIALDGTEYFSSRKILCQRCSTRRRSDGGTEYFAPTRHTICPFSHRDINSPRPVCGARPDGDQAGRAQNLLP